MNIQDYEVLGYIERRRKSLFRMLYKMSKEQFAKELSIFIETVERLLTSYICIGDTNGEINPPVDNSISANMRIEPGQCNHEFSLQTGHCYNCGKHYDSD